MVQILKFKICFYGAKDGIRLFLSTCGGLVTMSHNIVSQYKFLPITVSYPFFPHTTLLFPHYHYSNTQFISISNKRKKKEVSYVGVYEDNYMWDSTCTLALCVKREVPLWHLYHQMQPTGTHRRSALQNKP